MAERNRKDLEWRPWPVISIDGDSSDEVPAFFVRPFGSCSKDLDFDFSDAIPQVLVTGLLMRCLRPTLEKEPLEEEYWNWSLKRRLYGLLAITIPTVGPILQISEKCSGKECEELLILEVDLNEFNGIPLSENFTFYPTPKIKLLVRLPNGKDYLKWSDKAYFLEEGELMDFGTSLIVQINQSDPEEGWKLPHEWMEPLQSVLEQNDPLLNLNINTQCPVCDLSMELEIDLEDYLLSALARKQRSLLDQIHRIAKVYHWPEAEILALPLKRREFYLSNIEKEALA